MRASTIFNILDKMNRIFQIEFMSYISFSFTLLLAVSCGSGIFQPACTDCSQIYGVCSGDCIWLNEECVLKDTGAGEWTIFLS